MSEAEKTADKFVFECPKHSGYPAHVETFLAGWKARGERDAEIATLHAMEMGPSLDYGMGGHKISSKIRALDKPSEGRG